MRRGPVLAVAAVLSVLAACSTSSGVSSVEANETGGAASTEPGATSPARPEHGTLDWGACDTPSPAPGVDLECATLRVPLDHDDPDGDEIEIAVARVPTSEPDERIGSLVFNPGGPGGSGIEFLTTAALLVPDDIAEHFDLVGFDPRGVGSSTAVDCDLTIDDNITLLEQGDDAGWQQLIDEAEALPADCGSDTMELASLVGTNNAARDLDLLREALGDEQLSYVGFSYGTRLGATYAELFPDRVRALVLDGGVKPTDDASELDADQGAGFDLALANFAEACDADTDCVLAELGPVLETYASVVADISETGSFDTNDPERVLTPGELQLGVISALYSKDAWPFLAQALHDAATNRDGSLLQVLGDSLVGRDPDGTYDNQQEANLFINCADDPRRPDEATQRQLADASAAASVHFDDFLRASTGCIGTPDAVDPLIIGPADGAAPILVIGNSGDPATPYDWSVALADSLSSAVLFTVEAEGHTAFLTIECVNPIVEAYLIDLELPAEGESCSDNATADFFPPPGESDVDLIIALFDCLRENGADVPELTLADVLADPTGEKILAELDPADPAILTAVIECQDLLADL